MNFEELRGGRAAHQDAHSEVDGPAYVEGAREDGRSDQEGREGASRERCDAHRGPLWEGE